jgi:hypothetical protein
MEGDKMNTKTILAALLILFVLPFAFAAQGTAAGSAGGQSAATGNEVVAPQPTLTSETVTSTASTTSGGQSMATLVQSEHSIRAEEVNAISNDVTITPAAIVTATESTSASGKTITVQIDGQTVTVTPSISTVVIRDGNVIVNTTSVHLENGNMIVGSTEVSAAPSRIMENVQEREQDRNQTRESKELKLEESNGKAVYAHYATEQRKLLGVFPMSATITEQYSVETGDFVKEVHPWWYVLSTQAPEPTETSATAPTE